MKEQWQRARLIPVVGNGVGHEREQRATSALLAVLSIVRPFSQEVLVPLGASRAGRATVEAFIEPPFKDKTSKSWRPDGLIRVTYGQQRPWVALVEVKTGSSLLEADQINAYLDLARDADYDHVITISNELSPSIGVHPTPGIRVRKNSRVQVSHFSWTRVAALASRVRDRTGVEDLEQEWILSELLRYLEHQSSGAMEFDDMGQEWTTIRDDTRAGTLTRRTPGVDEVALRWDQLLTYAALKLSIRINEDVEEVLTRAHRNDPGLRRADFAKELVDHGSFSGDLRVPRTVGDLHVCADVRARQCTLSVSVDAPSDKKARGSLTWLTKQLEDAPSTVVVEAYAKGAQHPVVATLGDLHEDPSHVVAHLPADIVRFVVLHRRELSVNRRGGRSSGFTDSVIGQIFDFYDHVVQRLTPYQEKAPSVSPESSRASEQELGSETV